jgi:hypothetical protein
MRLSIKLITTMLRNRVVVNEVELDPWERARGYRSWTTGILSAQPVSGLCRGGSKGMPGWCANCRARHVLGRFCSYARVVTGHILDTPRRTSSGAPCCAEQESAVCRNGMRTTTYLIACVYPASVPQYGRTR